MVLASPCQVGCVWGPKNVGSNVRGAHLVTPQFH